MLQTELNGWFSQMYGEWLRTVDIGLAKRLDNTILLRNEETSLLELNFDKDLLRLFNEVVYWERLHQDIP